MDLFLEFQFTRNKSQFKYGYSKVFSGKRVLTLTTPVYRFNFSGGEDIQHSTLKGMF